MKYLFLIFVGIIFFSKSLAQNGYGSTSVYDRVVQLPKGKHIFVLMPNEAWEKQLWKDSVYEFPGFQEGRLEMAKGFSPSLRPLLNYNMLLGTVEIGKGDQVITTLRRTPDIKYIWIGEHKFVHDATFGYLEIISDGKAVLAQRTLITGVYEDANGFLFALDRVAGVGDYKGQVAKSKKYYWVDEDYFLLDENLKVYRPTSNVLSKLLPAVRKQVKEFSKENKINYKKKEDLIKIVTFANEQAGAVKTN